MTFLKSHRRHYTSILAKIAIPVILIILFFCSAPSHRLLLRLPLITIIIISPFVILMDLKKCGTSKLILDMGTLVSSVIFFFFVAELAFMFIPKSHGTDLTLAYRLWFKKYWKPINQLGFRDYEMGDTDLCKKRIFIMGDSFVAGCGIKDVAMRFSNILQKKIPRDICVLNMGMPNMDTLREFDILKSFPYEPDILVLTYTPNDINGRSALDGMPFVEKAAYSDLPFMLRSLFKNSYFLNFFYWEFPHQDLPDYYKFLDMVYANKRIFQSHLRDLQFFVEYTKQRGIPLIVIIFPYFDNNFIKTPQLKSVANFFLDQNIEVIDVYDLVSGLPVKKLRVSHTDLHPSILANQIVAKELYLRLKKFLK